MEHVLYLMEDHLEDLEGLLEQDLEDLLELDLDQPHMVEHWQVLVPWDLGHLEEELVDLEVQLVPLALGHLQEELVDLEVQLVALDQLRMGVLLEVLDPSLLEDYLVDLDLEVVMELLLSDQFMGATSNQDILPLPITSLDMVFKLRTTMAQPVMVKMRNAMLMEPMFATMSTHLQASSQYHIVFLNMELGLFLHMPKILF